MTPVPLVIVGAGGHGRELLDIVEATNQQSSAYEFLGFLDDGPGPWPRLARRNATVIGPLADLASTGAHYVLGLGSGVERERATTMADEGGRVAATLVHPMASRGSDLHLGEGLVMAAGARITTNVTVGRHVHLNLNATLSHDGQVGDFVTLNPGAQVNGNVLLGDGATVGSGAVIRQGISVGEGAMIGAGAVVVDDVDPGTTVIGVPARPVRR